MIASRSIETRNLAKCCVKDGLWSSRGDESRHPEGVSLRFMRGKGRKGETRRCAPVLANFAPSRARGLPRMKTRTRRKGTRPDLFSPDSPIFLALAIARLAKEKHTGSRLCTLVRRSEADCCHHRDPRPRGPHQCLNIRS